MPIPNYIGETWVAFMDISGFKQMMRRDNKAEKALEKFYNTVFRIAEDLMPTDNNISDADLASVRLSTLVVSDCAVVFVDNQGKPKDEIRDLRYILEFVSHVNRELISDAHGPRIMTTCSIDYGHFKYQERIEFEHIEKNFFYGQPYVNAYIDNETHKGKPGYCRVLRRNTMIPDNIRAESPFSLLEDSDSCYYFYWMLGTLESLAIFKREYEMLTQSLYDDMALLLERARAQSNDRGH